MNETERILDKTMRFGANNYQPLQVVLTKGEGVWVEDAEGRRYMDMLSAYSAVNQGHRHPKIIQALKEQADKITLTSRAFHNEVLAEWFETMSRLTGKERILPMNTGAEAVETAIKLARRWAYEIKKVTPDQAEIIVCEGNFHGRTLTITSFSTEPHYRRGFGPFTPGFKTIPYNDLAALEQAITPYTAAFLVEPVQGESGIIVPDAGYLKAAAECCKQHRVLLLADEIQTGFGRTGKRFASDWDGVEPDVYILGKALGGGVLPISAVCADDAVFAVIDPGSHGSTFGGNPLACAVSLSALQVFEEERLADRSLTLGAYMIEQVKKIRSPLIKEVRGKGLFIGIELVGKARPVCDRLMNKGLLSKDTHEYTIRLAPPLVITREEIDWALERLYDVLHSEEVYA
jgi:ornithine--oxo-acid transaminase